MDESYIDSKHEEWSRRFAAGDRLRELRNRKHLRLVDVSEALDIGVSTLSMYENGIRNPNDDTKIKLANFYGTTVHDIFFRKEGNEYESI